MPRKTVLKARCALCGAKEVSEPRGEEKYCRDCWEKKIAVEEVVAREFALKRYIRAHSAEKYLIYHSTIKRPCGQIIVVDDGYDLFLTMRRITSRVTRKAARSARFSSTSWPPKSSNRGGAASGTWKSSARPIPNPR